MAEKPIVWFVDDLPGNREAFKAHHKAHFAIKVFSKPGEVLKLIRKREYPDALLCDVFFYDSVKEAKRVENEIAGLAKELRKRAIEMDLYDDRHAAGIDLMRRIHEHFLKEGRSRPAFPIYAYTSKGPFLLEQKDWRKISTWGAQVLLKNRVTVETEWSEIDGDIQINKEAAQKLNRVFISHGKQKAIVGQLKKLLGSRNFEPVVSVERESTAIPVPEKVFEDMRSCGAGVIHVGAEGKYLDAEGKEHTKLNDNVLIEIGAAMALYGKKVILLVERGVRLPSNLQGLYRCDFEGDDRLNHKSKMKLLKTFSQFGKRGFADSGVMPPAIPR
jgi:Predicted nucleotide-binding protein containing TIR-like domain